jgi:hypothetical protein
MIYAAGDSQQEGNKKLPPYGVFFDRNRGLLGLAKWGITVIILSVLVVGGFVIGIHNDTTERKKLVGNAEERFR